MASWSEHEVTLRLCVLLLCSLFWRRDGRACMLVHVSFLCLNSALTRDSGSVCFFPPVGSQYGRRETSYIITPRQTGCAARVKINPLFNPKSLKNKLWALLPPVNSSGSEQNPVWLQVFIPSDAPALPLALSSKAPSAQQLSVTEQRLRESRWSRFSQHKTCTPR